MDRFRLCNLLSMSSVTDLVSPNIIDQLATTSNARRGRELVDGGEVTVTNSDPAQVDFQVGSVLTGRRRVELRASKDVLHWRCTCTSDPQLFCKHLVAAALSLAKPPE